MWQRVNANVSNIHKDFGNFYLDFQSRHCKLKEAEKKERTKPGSIRETKKSNEQNVSKPNILGLCREKEDGEFEQLTWLCKVDAEDKRIVPGSIVYFPIHSGSKCGIPRCKHMVPPSNELPRDFLEWLVKKFANDDGFWGRWAGYFKKWLDNCIDKSWSFMMIAKYDGVPPPPFNYNGEDFSRLTCTEPYLCFTIEHMKLEDCTHYLVSLKDACATCASLIKMVQPRMTFQSFFRCEGSPLTVMREHSRYWVWWKLTEN